MSEAEHRVRVLIGDDHRLVRDLVRLILERSGEFRVIGEAANGHEAIALAERLRPDIVLLDISMPGMDGLEAARRIRLAREATIVFLTGEDSDAHSSSAREVGAAGYVLKSALGADLIETLRGAHHGSYAATNR
jgi:DNA-binding NarL/FixJ family response regulator